MAARDPGAKKALKKTNKNLKAASKTAKVDETPTRRKETKQLRKVVVSRIHPDSELGKWFAALAKPFEAPMGITCPVNYNPAPSFIQTTARTTYTNLSFQVAAGTTAQMVIFGGHGKVATAGIGDVSPMDPVAFHHPPQQISSPGNPGFDIVSLSPIDQSSPARFGAIGAITTGLAAGAMTNSTTSASAVAMYQDVSMPYSSSSEVGHCRWQLVAMGLRARNNTPELSRGGTIITVQPNTQNVTAFGAQADLDQYPTFRDHGVGDGPGVEVAWIPKPQDMAMWHTIDASGYPAGTELDGAAILAFFNAPAGNAQTYSYEVVCHWQLAGRLIQSIGRTVPHQPSTQAVVEPTLAHVINSSHTAAVVPRVGAVVAAHDPQAAGPSLGQKLADLVMSAKAGVATAGKFAKGMAAFVA